MSECSDEPELHGPSVASGPDPGAPAEAFAVLDAAWDAVNAAYTSASELRWWQKRQYAKAIQACHTADRRFQTAVAAIAHARVGAIPGQWGLLSDDLESTLDDFVHDVTVSDALRERLADVASRVLEARIRAHTDDRSLERALADELADCLNLKASDPQTRRLLHHLPGWARPLPELDMGAVAHSLSSGGSPPFGERYFHYRDCPWAGSVPQRRLVRFIVSFKTIDTLELHDIIRDSINHVKASASTAGLGSAALQHLCRSADNYGLSIFGKIMPGDRTESSAARLSNWYGRHGFDIELKRPDEFLWATVRRAPGAAR